MEFLYLDVVGFGFDGSFGGKYSDVACGRELSYYFGCRAYDSKDSVLGCVVREVVLLYASEGFC